MANSYFNVWDTMQVVATTCALQSPTLDIGAQELPLSGAHDL